MIRGIPALRAIGLVSVIAMMIAFVTVASADEPPKPAAPVVVPAEKPAAPAAAPAPAPKPEPDWVRKGLYFGPAFGVADSGNGTAFGWALDVLYRPFRYGGMQLEYFNLGDDDENNGDLDGLYLGVAPMLPLAQGFSLFAQGGYSFTSGDDGGVGGGGLLYDIPLDPMKKYLPGGLTARLDYKFFDFDSSAHLVTAGLMYRFGFVTK